MDGRGRQELIDALTAGGRLPDSYYDKDKQATFVISENND